MNNEHEAKVCKQARDMVIQALQDEGLYGKLKNELPGFEYSKELELALQHRNPKKAMMLGLSKIHGTHGKLIMDIPPFMRYDHARNFLKERGIPLNVFAPQDAQDKAKHINLAKLLHDFRMA